jgi:hypothetical protein
MAEQLLGATQPGGKYHRIQFVQCIIQDIVNDNIIEFGNMGYILAYCRHSFRNHLMVVLAASLEALFQRLQGWRQYEDADAFRKQAADLRRALPVDLQQEIAPLVDFPTDPGLRSPVKVAVDFGAFQLTK